MTTIPDHCPIYDGPGYCCFDCTHGGHAANRGVTTRQLTGADPEIDALTLMVADSEAPPRHRVLNAEYDGQCSRCDGKIKPGDAIVHDPSDDKHGGTIHVRHLDE